MPRTHSWVLIFAALLTCFVLTANVQAQLGNESPLKGLKLEPGLFGAEEDEAGDEFEISAFIVPQRGKLPTMLAVRVVLAPDYHIFSITQPKGGPERTQILLDESTQYRLLGSFKPIQPPEVTQNEVWKDLPIEEHYDEVTWVAPIELTGADPSAVKITGELEGQVCIESFDKRACIPLALHDSTFTAVTATAEQLASLPSKSTAPKKPEAMGEFAPPKGNPIIRGHIEPKVVAPGQTAKLVITVQPKPDWHVYAREDTVAPLAPYRPTIIALTNTSGLAPRTPVVDKPVVEKEFLDDVIKYHEGPTTWTVDLPIPADAAPGPRNIQGEFGYQICTDNTCDAPQAVTFQATVEVGPQTVPGSVPVGFSDSGYGVAKNALEKRVGWQDSQNTNTTAGGFDPTNLTVDDGSGGKKYSFAAILAMAFLGGLILNVMPCVLPVIGFKILNFFEQAGHDQRKAFVLNMWYAGGVIAVFLALATVGVISKMVVGAEFGWGQQFNYPSFVIVMTAFVFVFALSMLGVWEIPVPGFVGSSGANKLAQKEGPMGAFTTGIITTIVATPCSAPFLGTALALVWALPAYCVYAAFFSMGLGLAAPYLIIGSSLSAMKFLPKPGVWMVVVKQVSGFLLLLPVIIFLLFIPPDLVVPTLGLLLALGIACWLVGTVPMTASPTAKASAWVGAVAIVVVIGGASYIHTMNFGLFRFPSLRGFATSNFEGQVDRAIADRLAPSDRADSVTNVSEHNVHELPWQPYSEERLIELTSQGKTVMIDFTADWCFTCKSLETNVLNTEEINSAVKKNDVVPLIADWTDKDPKMFELMGALGSRQVPVLAIFPGDRPNEPIVFRGGNYNIESLLAALEKAGPSVGAQGDESRTAMVSATESVPAN